jgi:hypothetical protein
MDKNNENNKNIDNINYGPSKLPRITTAVVIMTANYNYSYWEIAKTNTAKHYV